MVMARVPSSLHPPSPGSPSLPTADDLIFLLSIVSNPESIGDLNQQTQSTKSSSLRKGNATRADGSDCGIVPSYSSWQQALAPFPSQRSRVITALRRLADANEKWINLFFDSNLEDFGSGGTRRSNHWGGGNTIDVQDSRSKSTLALEDVEVAATKLRSCSTEYVNSLSCYRFALEHFWIREECLLNSELAQVGCQLSSQLILQFEWDMKMAHAILIFLDDELYNKCNHRIVNSRIGAIASNNKLRTWADAMLTMMQLDKSFWDFVEREVYDDTELMENDDPQFLNDSPSSRTIDFPSVQHVKQGKTPQHQNLGKFEQGDLHERIVSSASVEEAVNVFLHDDDELHPTIDDNVFGCRRHCSVISILVVGDEGSGKTHLLDSIQQRANGFLSDSKVSKRERDTPSIKVIRPKFPIDLVGNIVGSSEDRLISLFSYACGIVSAASGKRGGKCLIMLDDIDKIFSLSNNDYDETSDVAPDGGSSSQFYTGRRCKVIFSTIMDALRESWSSLDDGHLLLICTSRSMCGGVRERMDKTFILSQPDECQRRQLIISCLSNFEDIETDSCIERVFGCGDVNQILSLVVHHSAGRSAVELSQCCRNAILIDAESTGSDGMDDPGSDRSSIIKRRLIYLDRMLQAMSPQSLRGGSLDGIVDMRIFTPEELQSTLKTDASGEVQMPLFGAEAKQAYEALMNVVITPLCCSDDIRNLLYGGSSNVSNIDPKPIRVGALLAGAPGVGKSSLAYHCASLAAKMSRVTLLDVNCTSLIHKEIGGSERAVHRLFAAVRAAAPCILLLDGIENIASRRGNDNTSEGTMDRVLSTFLIEMDGIETGNGDASGNVAVIGITHNPNLIDPALRRPGRLEKTITLGAPDFEARRDCGKTHQRP